MINKGDKVLVYDGDFIGWTNGILIQQSKMENNKWVIETEDKSNLIRYVKEIYEEIRKDGCGYVVKI